MSDHSPPNDEIVLSGNIDEHVENVGYARFTEAFYSIVDYFSVHD